jgi:hypothetical protein
MLDDALQWCCGLVCIGKLPRGNVSNNYGKKGVLVIVDNLYVSKGQSKRSQAAS